MLRIFALAFTLSCVASSAWAQTQPASGTAAVRAATRARPDPSKPAPKAQTEAKSARPAEIGRCEIGVIPIAGNLFTIERMGPFRFNDTYARATADGWGLDDLVVARVRAAARGAAVRRIAFSKEDLARARDRNSASFFRNRSSELKDFARQVAAGTNCDRYVVVHRSSGGKPVFGIGIVKVVSLHDSRIYLFVLMNIQVYDGRTFELSSERLATINDESFLASAYLNPIGGPYLALDERSFPASRAEVAANPILRDGVRGLLTGSLDKTLPAMLRQRDLAR
jgi:hypothetical protein